MTDRNSPGAPERNDLEVVCFDLDTRDKPVAVLRADAPLVRSEGFAAHARITVCGPRGELLATLYQTDSELLGCHQIGLSRHAAARLQVRNRDRVHIRHPRPLQSTARVRAKVLGRRLDRGAFQAIMADIAAGRYDDIELAMFLTAIAAHSLDDEELMALTAGMVDAGERLAWAAPMRVDKHCIGGLPGNRTTPIVVAIVAANGLCIPKTSSRAITSPAGTADTMETLAPVNLGLSAMRRVVEAEGGCVVWGGAVSLSPVDDLLIRVSRVMDLDAEAQMVASILSKKIAAGSTHLVIDVPVGATAKVRSRPAAEHLAGRLCLIAKAFGVQTRVVTTDGSQPVGHGIGPALEAHDVLAVLDNDAEAPADLRERAVSLAAILLEMGGKCAAGHGRALAEQTLDSGRAGQKFSAICQAQGGMRQPPRAALSLQVYANRAGTVGTIDCRRLARVAKLAGAPAAPAAGVVLRVRLGDRVETGQELYTIHAETRGELNYAREYAGGNGDIIEIIESGASP